ncbi:diguanylate cyclase [Pseudoduganella umbonata]|uniref:diguanylate cyclase n=1 Tax=Pseudoduganella umbonata TaxID=864828 RepID=A0A4P8HPS5_9BURK|nr:diguanylate cyclase [Pseudoduganella umbonata]MBB3221142.1 diguanylate cyclase (GGDEF)-like protein [Pseudoduganella umbonata]QCP10335.1 diguanylate cyclase [Pseudoduganella umbonata]
MKVETKLKLAAACIVVVMSAIALLPHFVTASVTEVMAELDKAIAREREYGVLLNYLSDAEAAERGYVITGRQEFLEPYHEALAALPAVGKALGTGPIPAAEQKALEDIARLTAAKTAYMREVVRVRSADGAEAARALVDTGRGKQYMDELRVRIGAQETAYANYRAGLRAQLAARSSLAANVTSVATAIDIVLLILAGLAGNRVLTQRRKAEQHANDISRQLRLTADIAERRNVQLQSGGEMLHALELAETLEEGAQIVALYFSRLLPALSGSMYLYRHSRDILERKATWGQAHDPDIIEPLDCWALRKGTQHFTHGDEGTLACRHVAESGARLPRICVPLVTQGNVIGFITAEGMALGQDDSATERAWIMQLSEQVALALSNVQLRASLRHQSVIDPLTQLYNRRYLDETLKRELARAVRRGAPLAVIMLDLDHFKRVNDTFGHEAGDLLLRHVGTLLLQSIRGSDVACRYGGEELILLLPDCSLEHATARAGRLRQQIRALNLAVNKDVLTASASFGVAAYPVHGDTPEALLQAADAAMYAAKHGGRDRVDVAPLPAPVPVQ